MSDRDELRRLAETTINGIGGIYVQARELKQMLDAADRGDRAVELLRECDLEPQFPDEHAWYERLRAFLAEIDK